MSAARSPESAGSRAMPAWKRAILERKRAKLTGGSGARDPSPGRGYPGGRSRSPARKHTRSPLGEGSPEPGVLQESLGPLRQNPFIRLEQERRRRRQQQPPRGPPSPGAASATPIQQLLDLYSNVPGIRTIRAENIIIIESDQEYFQDRGGGRTASHPNPLEELLTRRGSKVTEIRASEVVIYEPLSRSQEDLSSTEIANGPPGRVSRLMEKFNQGKPKPQRSRSTDSLLDVVDSYPKLRDTKPKNPIGSPGEGAFNYGVDTLPLASTHHPVRSMSSPAPDPSSNFSPSLTPTSPLSSPGSVTSYSPTSPFEMWSPEQTEAAQEEDGSPTVPSFKQRFENYTMLVNQPQPLSKLKNYSQKMSSNTITVNPRATSSAKVNIPNNEDHPFKETSILSNGYASYTELEMTPKEAVNIQDLLSKTKKENPTNGRTSDRHSEMPPSQSTSNVELLKGAKTWRPKSEIDLIRSKFSSKPSATPLETAKFNHNEELSSSATPNQQQLVSASTSTNSTFEIKPAPKPDLSNIPDSDIQAKALANIRMQSKNSFVFIPKRRSEPFPAAQKGLEESSSPTTPNQPNRVSPCSSRQTEFTYSSLDKGSQSKENGPFAPETLTSKDRVDATGVAKTNVNSFTEDSPSTLHALSDFDWSSGLLPSYSDGHSFTDEASELEYFSSVHDDVADGPFTVPVTSIHDEEFTKAELPITYIDDIVNSEEKEAKSDSRSNNTIIPSYRPHTGSSEIHFKGGNTFTIVPKRKPAVSQYEGFGGVGREQEDDEDEEMGSKTKAGDGSEAPYSDLGMRLKKRYPTVDEIEVIGGYMSLKKSCLTKNASTRKKMKISFNETSLQTMFEYPSESSLAEDEDEEEDVSGSEAEEEEKPYSLFLPRPSFITNNASNNSLRSNASNSGLSTYTPKHSVEYSKWQEKKYEEKPSMVGVAHQEGDHGRKNMLTPADSNSLSDFNSEPALYF